jgi:alanine racemase
MTVDRRTFVAATAAFGISAPSVRGPAAHHQSSPMLAKDQFDPWLEIDTAALRRNVDTVSRLAGGRPILAVVKNNAYGLGLTTVCPILDGMPGIAGFAVVKESAALALRDAGVTKPILLMGMFSPSAGPELVARNILLSFYTDDVLDRVRPLAQAAGKPVAGHVYLDTGMGRMGMPYYRAADWLGTLAGSNTVSIRGTYMAFTEEPDFDPEQLARFRTVMADARDRGVDLRTLHAASSNGVYHLPEAHLDLVRPGIALYGAYPSEPAVEHAKAPLTPAVRLRARVVRVVQLRPGDSVSYGRQYVAQEPTWTATIPVGHSDGFTRRAVDGARVLIGGSLYPVIGAVSASHAIVEVGREPTVAVGDVATLVGSDDPAIRPNALADSTGTSVYDVLMHLNPGLPRIVV